MVNHTFDDTNTHEIFPFEIKNDNGTMSNKFPEIKDRHVFVGPKNYCFAASYKDVASKLYNFEARPDDVWILGFPRSGTTLTSELVWLLGNNLDYQKASETVMDLRFPVLEGAAYFCQDYERITAQRQLYKGETAEIAEKLSKPAWESLSETREKRFIKTHLPLSLAPSNILTSGCKVIYLARNPKDVCVSSYLLLNSYKTVGIDESFDKFWNYFHHGLVPCTPYFEHVKEAWEAKDNPNVLFVFYENYSKDMELTIRTLARFLGKKIADSDVHTLIEHVKIDNFRKNKSVNSDHLRELGILKDTNDSFIRKGVVGGWNEFFQEHVDVEADNWINENLKMTRLKFS
ncbi:hypothetical protein Zmor_022568 [Zophobas morio]|uniref:Sulfotransferase domain-containing protein n=1 Tax=Zophobas morio TaxID=2755281 RepID=A0AA38HX74_9CUCU|nr:hypothetical protein Zmor_022568 [Zophobas morio]